jgi:hypothetical protein
VKYFGIALLVLVSPILGGLLVAYFGFASIHPWLVVECLEKGRPDGAISETALSYI